MYAKIKACLSDELLESGKGRDSHLLAQGVLGQDAQDVEDL